MCPRAPSRCKRHRGSGSRGDRLCRGIRRIGQKTHGRWALKPRPWRRRRLRSGSLTRKHTRGDGPSPRWRAFCRREVAGCFHKRGGWHAQEIPLLVSRRGGRRLRPDSIRSAQSRRPPPRRDALGGRRRHDHRGRWLLGSRIPVVGVRGSTVARERVSVRRPRVAAASYALTGTRAA
jgi:hypothetical protein